MRETDSIAVVIPCFNEQEDLFLCLDSVLNQTVLPQEIIIVDDASSNEKTLEILKEIEKRDNVKVIYSRENKGPGIARNIAIENSSSSWILLLDSDDFLMQGTVEKLTKAIKERQNASFFFWNYYLNDTASNTKSVVSTISLCKDNDTELDPYKLARNFIMPGCSPFKKELWTTIKGYDPQLSKGGVEDIDFWRRAIMAGAVGYHIDQTLYQWNRRVTGNNSNIDEYKYLIHRQKMLPYYDKYNPDQAKEIRPYIYRYYSSRLMAKKLNDFLKVEKGHFSIWNRLKAKVLFVKPVYKMLRKLSNLPLWNGIKGEVK